MTKARDLASGAPAPAGVTTTELGFVDGVTSAIQTQVDGKAATSHNHDTTYVNQSTFDAKGDLIVGTGNDAYARLAVSPTNGDTIVADASTATGLKWGIPNAVGCAVTNTTPQQTIANSTWTALNFNDEFFDTNNFHSTTTNTSRFTATFAGKYQFNHSDQWGLNSAGQRGAAIYKNGTALAYFPSVVGSAAIYVGNTFSFVCNLAVNDYLEVFVYQTSGANVVCYVGAGDGNNSFIYLGA